jgi:hypothetical protein
MPTVEPSTNTPIEILIVAGNRIAVHPVHVEVRWDYNGTIVWTLAGDTNIMFRDAGVWFDEKQPRYTNPKVINPWRCQVSVVNDVQKETGKAISYRLLLWRDGKPIHFDPTVESDPPPPPY